MPRLLHIVLILYYFHIWLRYLVLFFPLFSCYCVLNFFWTVRKQTATCTRICHETSEDGRKRPPDLKILPASRTFVPTALVVVWTYSSYEIHLSLSLSLSLSFSQVQYSFACLHAFVHTYLLYTDYCTYFVCECSIWTNAPGQLWVMAKEMRTWYCWYKDIFFIKKESEKLCTRINGILMLARSNRVQVRVCMHSGISFSPTDLMHHFLSFGLFLWFDLEQKNCLYFPLLASCEIYLELINAGIWHETVFFVTATI